MRQKKLIALCIAMAFSNNGYAAEVLSDSTENTNLSCPTDLSKLTPEQRKKLPAKCLDDSDNSLAWILGGVTAAVATGIAVAVSNNGGDDDSDSSYTPPTPPTPPDDGGDTPTPPDDGGGDTPTPPDAIVKIIEKNLDKPHVMLSELKTFVQNLKAATKLA